MGRLHPKLVWTATGLAVLALLLVVADGALAWANLGARAETEGRQQYINQSVQLARINQALVNALAQAAMKDDDHDIRALLAANGITINAPANPPAADKK